MDRQKVGSPSQYAREFCDCVGARAAEVGVFDGSITAKRHEGKVSRVNLQIFEPSRDQPDEPPAQISPPEVGIAEARRILRRALEESLAEFTVRFGDVTLWFNKGALQEVWVTTKFRIDDEIPQLARFFSPPPSGIARDGQRSREAADSGGAKPR